MPELTNLDPAKMKPPMNTTLVVDGAGLEKVSDFIRRVPEYGFDKETNVVDFYRDRVVRTIQLGNRDEQYVVDLLAFAGSKEKLIAAQGNYGRGVDPCLNVVKDVFRPSLESRSHLKVGANLGFEYICAKWCFGIRMQNLWGIDIAERILLAGLVMPMMQGHFAMDDLTKKYLWLIIDKTLQTSFDLETPLTPEQVTYAALDTRLPLGIRQAQLGKLLKDGLERVAQIEFDAIGAFEDMHMNGFFLNRDAWQALIDSNLKQHVENIAKLDEHFIPIVGRKGDLNVDLDALENEWKDTPNKTAEDKAARATKRQAYMAARKSKNDNLKAMKTYEGEAAINYGSPIQLTEALHQVKGLNKKTLPDTGDDTLKKLADKFPIMAALRDMRTTQKNISTYGEEWFEWIRPETGRIHSRLNQIGTDTGRPSSARPNLYNLPNSKEARACWQAQPNPGGKKKKLGKNDMAGAELRILAELANAPTWLEAFEKNWDIHCVATEILYPDKWPSIGLPDCAYFTKDHQKCKCPKHNELRNGTKATHFLIINGGGPRKLSTDLGCEYDVAMELMNKHQRKFADIWGYLDRSGKIAATTMEAVRSIAGRRRQFFRPTWEQAQHKCLEEFKKLKRKELPLPNDISKKMRQLFGMIERAGKNAPLQMSNADLAKLAFGQGYDDDGIPFLWHILEPKYGVRQVNFVYDEIVYEGDEDVMEEAAAEIADAIYRAGKMLLKKVVMNSEWEIGDVWIK